MMPAVGFKQVGMGSKREQESCVMFKRHYLKHSVGKQVRACVHIMFFVYLFVSEHQHLCFLCGEREYAAAYGCPEKRP